MKTGPEVKFYRRAHGFSRGRLARMIGLRVPQLAEIEQGRRPIPEEAVGTLSQLLSFPVARDGR